MPSLHNHSTRHVVIDRREGHYLAFPDVIRAADDRLVVAYNEMNEHVRPDRRVVVVRTSDDHGRTWSPPVYPDSPSSHCPRLLRLADGRLLISDSSRIFHTSSDNGETWTPMRTSGLSHDMHDRVLILDDGSWLTAGHRHVGEEHPAIRQPPTEQVVFRSTDRGATWERISVLAAHRNLTLCEASMLRLPDGRIMALMRENSFVFEPMYACFSRDGGLTWSDPAPTPLIGHRPTMGLLPGGNLLVTYRNTGPDWGTCAWTGKAEELLSGFRVHGRAADPGNPTFTEDGMRVRNEAGNASVVRYALRPMTDPRTATLCFETIVRVDRAGANGCGIRAGLWWRLFPDAIVPDAEDAQPIPLEPGRFNRIKLEYTNGEVALSVNGARRALVRVDPDHAETRPVMFGAPYPFEDNAVDCTWQRADLAVNEPAYGRNYSWSWRAQDGPPDQWMRDNILELRNDRHAAAPDFGYSGWCETGDGRLFCAYHHGNGTERGYEPLKTAHVAGTWFTPDDFK
jgi:hypothetical protein